MLKKIGIPLVALAVVLMFVAVPQANARVHFSVGVVAPGYYPPYPYVYSYPYGYSGYYYSPTPYYYPRAYGYYSYPSYGYHGYYGGHVERWHGHESHVRGGHDRHR